MRAFIELLRIPPREPRPQGADIWRAAGDDDASPDAVFPKLAVFTRVCAYDRPGTTLGTDQFSRSDAVPMPRSTADAVNDLHQLLAAAPVPGPYVMVGHSTGGLVAGNAGNCSPDPIAPAPAISRNGVLLALALLLAIGGAALLRRQRGA